MHFLLDKQILKEPISIVWQLLFLLYAKQNEEGTNDYQQKVSDKKTFNVLQIFEWNNFVIVVKKQDTISEINSY